MMETVKHENQPFQEAAGLPFVTATQLSRNFNQVLKELEVHQVVEIQRKGVSNAVLLDIGFFQDLLNIIESQKDCIEQLEDMAAVKKYQDTPKEERVIIPWREAFTMEDIEDNEFMSMSNEELFD